MKLPDNTAEFDHALRQIRRDIHAHPELCYEEQRTSDIVAEKLAQWDIPVIRGLGLTGVVGIVKGRAGNSTRGIGFRADMDALPLQEINNFDHASTYQGKMHACGHDGHTAILLGAAYQLSKNRDFDGTVYLIFQPAEEGGGGARRMIDDGLFEQCPMDAIFGLHNWPGMRAGTFGVRPGAMMASSNEFEVTVLGRGSHAAQPHKSIDPVLTAIQVVQGWQTIVSRNANPHDSAVLSVTQINAGSATNIIADFAVLGGTVRTFDLGVLDMMEQRMEEIARHTGAAYGAGVDFKFHRNYPPLINHPRETAFAVKVMQELVGAENVESNTEPSMGAEDFAYFLQHKPGCYIFLGNGDGDHRSAGHGLGPCNLHNPSYDFNDDLLPVGAALWVAMAFAWLGSDAAAIDAIQRR
ncbi:MAG: M20 aminoacylase family protein [Janthinobacterium lividum]